jgi:hypothetical protein
VLTPLASFYGSGAFFLGVFFWVSVLGFSLAFWLYFGWQLGLPEI